MRLVAAILVAIIGTICDRRNPWPRVRGFLILMRELWRGKKARPERFEARMAVCPQCPLFFKWLRTCGKPWGENRDLGCWCHMPTKAKLESGSCWLRERGLGVEHGGWPIGL